MKDIKIIFFDIDGTLIDVNKKDMSEKTKETLLRLRNNNIILCLATGRPALTLPRFEGIEFDAFLTYNGSYCYTKGETIFSQPIPRDDVKKVLENAKALKRPVSIASRDRLAANGKDKDLVDYFALAKVEVEVSKDFEKIAEDEIYQIMLGSEKKDYDRLMEGVTGARITAWWDRAVDIIPYNAGKGIGVDKILEYFHLNRENALAFGDGSNDIEMLQTVSTGVAMGNASNEVKAAADDVCKSVQEDGIYYYCISHGLI